MKSKLLALVGLLLFAFCVSAQHVFLVSLVSKDTSYSINESQRFLSAKAIARRQKFSIPITENDFPLNKSFIALLQQNGYEPITQSKWLNAIVVKTTSKRAGDTLKQFTGVKEVKYLGVQKPIQTNPMEQADINEMLRVLDAKFENKEKLLADTIRYGKAWNQVEMLNVHTLHQQGYEGNNVLVAVLDAGFNNVHKLPVFKKLFDENRIVTTVDFVQKDSMVFEDDDHGMAVLSCMAGNINGEFVGTAPQASYALLRSEYARTEMPIEEIYWAEAIEFADSMGADIVNSSLGYNEFDDASFNHVYKDLNGKKSIISQAASLAVSKGMVVVVSAGNEGDEDWRFVSVPADVAEVITVGAVSPDGYLAAFSSIGPTADKRIKPNVVAQGDNVWVASTHGVFYQGDGTSYACPLLTGAIACLMQAHPSKNPTQIMEAIHQSANRYDKPNVFYGYGIPDMELAHRLLSQDSIQKFSVIDAKALGDKKIHVAFYAMQPTKVSVILRDELEQIFYKDDVTVKRKGVHRIGFKKSNKLKKGIYSLQILTKEHTYTQTINLH